MKLRASLRPAIRRMNQTLRKLEAAGVSTVQECIRDRGEWAKLHKPRRIPGGGTGG